MLEQNVNDEYNINVIFKLNIDHETSINKIIDKLEQMAEVNFAKFVDYE